MRGGKSEKQMKRERERGGGVGGNSQINRL